METTLFQLPGMDGEIHPTTAAPDLEADDTAVDLRLHCTGLAHFFAAFEPRRQGAAPPRFPATTQRESSSLNAATAG